MKFQYKKIQVIPLSSFHFQSCPPNILFFSLQLNYRSNHVIFITTIYLAFSSFILSHGTWHSRESSLFIILKDQQHHNIICITICVSVNMCERAYIIQMRAYWLNQSNKIHRNWNWNVQYLHFNLKIPTHSHTHSIL